MSKPRTRKRRSYTAKRCAANLARLSDEIDSLTAIKDESCEASIIHPHNMARSTRTVFGAIKDCLAIFFRGLK